MRSRLLLVIILITTFSITIQAQPSTVKETNRFAYAKTTFRQFIALNVRATVSSDTQALLWGTEIAGLAIDSSGNIVNTFILNSIGNEFDKEVIRVFNSTAGHWLKDSSQAITYIILPIAVEPVENKFEINWDKAPSSMLSEIIILIRFPGQLQSDEKLKSDLFTYQSKKEYNWALDAVDELIARNPFKREYFIARAQLYRSLRKNDLACADIKRIIYMLKQSAPEEFQHYCK
ncbi:MAG TPA: hypothetical protein VMV56_00800 [Williamwhitmania sp.]|nr:hypothetical protein [Williamwhitmania sp.]